MYRAPLEELSERSVSSVASSSPVYLPKRPVATKAALSAAKRTVHVAVAWIVSAPLSDLLTEDGVENSCGGVSHRHQKNHHDSQRPDESGADRQGVARAEGPRDDLAEYQNETG